MDRVTEDNTLLTMEVGGTEEDRFRVQQTHRWYLREVETSREVEVVVR